MVVLWITLGIIAGVIVVGVLGRFVWTRRPQAGMRGLPTTPLERLGWLGLAITAALAIGVGALVAVYGATAFQEDSTPRGIFWILMVVGIGVWSGAWYVINRPQGGAVVDERDRAILTRSLSVEAMFVLSLAGGVDGHAHRGVLG